MRTPPPAPAGLDGAELRRLLTKVAKAHEGEPRRLRAEAVALLKTSWIDARAAARTWLEAGASGLLVARQLSASADAVVSALHDFVLTHVIRSSNPTEGERFALVAVGGYGRGVLAPYSDVDLLMLRAWKLTPHVESVAEYLMPMLWDVGFKVGWSARSVDESLRAGQENMSVRTALLETRLVAGDATLLRTLETRFRAEIVRGSEAAFVAAKLRERDERHARAGASRYLVEPDVKTGKGGLRDLHTLFWIARYLDQRGGGDASDPVASFSEEERRGFRRAFDFLWTVRCRLHFAAARAEERLGFQWQPLIAREMGYRDRTGRPAVERFMRRYFFAVREAGVLTRTLCARLEASEGVLRSRGLSRFLHRPSFRAPLKDRAFHIRRRRLALRRPDAFSRDPADLMRLFRAADRHDVDLSPETFEAVRRSGLIAVKARSDPATVDAFLAVLAEGRDPQRTLSLMNEAGLLGRFMPEFGRIVARTQFNMYHAFTVDEHTLRAVGVLRAVADGRTGGDAGAPAAFRRLRDKRAVFLAALLHDVGKASAEAQEIAGERHAREACRRLDLPPPQSEAVAWLVRRHLLMSETAQKRDLNDPDTIDRFVAVVDTPERLRGLLVLTVADIQAVGPGVWNGWKAELLRQLHDAALARLGERRGASKVDPARRRRALARRSPSSSAWAEALEDDYYVAFSGAERQAHAELASKNAFGARMLPETGRAASTLAVVAPDRLGLFADVAAAIAGRGAGVSGARAYTSAAGQALDVFHLQDEAGGAFGAGNAERASALEAAVLKVLRAGAAATETRRRPARTRAFKAPAEIVVEPSPSGGLRVEASGPDRPGLLGALARVCAEAGLSIRSAHVETLGERAADVLYLRRPAGSGAMDDAAVGSLTAALKTVFEDGDQPTARTATEEFSPASTSPRSSRSTAASSASGKNGFMM